MKTTIKTLAGNEKGQALLLAIILLLVGGLIVAPLLAYMGTGILTGEVYETRTAELYAADAGVENAVQRISGNDSSNFTIPHINSKSVAVNITCASNTTQKSGCNVTRTLIYKVVSTATGDGSGTRIVAYVNSTTVSLDYSDLTKNVVTSLYDYRAAGTLSYPPENAPYPNYPPQNWPPASLLSDFYWAQVRGKTNYSSPIDLAGNNTTLQAGYVNGPLTIANSDKSKIPTLKLNGTLYITGDTTIAYSSGGGGLNKGEMILDLNGNTIFVNSTTAKYALCVGDYCDIKGPGVLIAVGGIYFKPKSQVTTDPVFVLSVLGETQMQPMGNFYGAVAGNVTVTLQPNTSLTYPIGGFGTLNFPGLGPAIETNPVCRIESWEVSGL
jgi:hypothetical protein